MTVRLNFVNPKGLMFWFAVLAILVLITQWVPGWTTSGYEGQKGKDADGDFEHPQNDCGPNWYWKLLPHPISNQGQCLGQVRDEDFKEAVERRMRMTKTSPNDAEGMAQVVDDVFKNFETLIRNVLSKPKPLD